MKQILLAIIICISPLSSLYANNTLSKEQKVNAYQINWDTHKQNWDKYNYQDNLKIGSRQVIFGLGSGCKLGYNQTKDYLFTQKNILKPQVFIPITLGLVMLYKTFQALWYKDLSFLWFRLFKSKMLPIDVEKIMSNAKNTATKQKFQQLKKLNTYTNKALLNYAKDHDAAQIVVYMQKQKDFIDKYCQLTKKNLTIHSSEAQQFFSQKTFAEQTTDIFIQGIAQKSYSQKLNTELLKKLSSLPTKKDLQGFATKDDIRNIIQAIYNAAEKLSKTTKKEKK